MYSSFYTVGIYQQQKTFKREAGALDLDFNKRKKKFGRVSNQPCLNKYQEN